MHAYIHTYIYIYIHICIYIYIYIYRMYVYIGAFFILPDAHDQDFHHGHPQVRSEHLKDSFLQNPTIYRLNGYGYG